MDTKKEDSMAQATIIETRCQPPEAINKAVKAIKAVWASALLYDSDAPDANELVGDEPGLKQAFVYLDELATFSWGFRGRAASNQNDMIHLIAEDDGKLTVITGARQRDDIDKILTGIRDNFS